MTLVALPSNIRVIAAHRAADVLDIIAVSLFTVSALIVAASVPFYWLSGLADALSVCLRPQQRG